MRIAALVSLILALLLFAVMRSGRTASALVTITPLGSAEGEFCVGDRALLFEDPTGVRVLIAPGRTVNGSGDSRIAPLGSVLPMLSTNPLSFAAPCGRHPRSSMRTRISWAAMSAAGRTSCST